MITVLTYRNFSALKTHLYHFAKTIYIRALLSLNQDFSKWNLIVLKHSPKYPIYSNLSHTHKFL